MNDDINSAETSSEENTTNNVEEPLHIIQDNTPDLSNIENDLKDVNSNLSIILNNLNEINGYLVPDPEDQEQKLAIEDSQLSYYTNSINLLHMSFLTDAILAGLIFVLIFSSFWRKHS